MIRQAELLQGVLQVEGPAVRARQTIVTRPATTIGEVILEAAESLYGALRPLGLASYLATRHPDRALEIVQQVIAGGSSLRERAEAHHLWGVLLRQDDHFDQAREQLLEAIRLARLSIREKQGRWPARARAWLRAPERRSDQFGAILHIDLGHTWRFQGFLDEAIRAYRKATVFDPESDAPHYYWALALEERADARLGDLDAAIRHYRAALHQQRHLVEAWDHWGQILVRQGSYEKAVGVLRQASLEHFEPGRAAALAHDLFAEALFAMGRYDEAGVEYLHAMAVDRSFAPAGYATVLGILSCPAAVPGLPT